MSRVRTNRGDIGCEVVVLGLGAWTPKHWAMLGKPMEIDARYADGATVRKDMWTYGVCSKVKSMSTSRTARSTISIHLCCTSS